MPTFHSPRKVVVTEGGGDGLAAALAVVALAAVISSAAVIIEDVLNAVMITMVALALAGTGVLAIVLRRHGLAHPLPPRSARTSVPAPVARPATAITAPLKAVMPLPISRPGATSPLAIEAPRPAFGPGAVHQAADSPESQTPCL
jgi:hypothetical protein